MVVKGLDGFAGEQGAGTPPPALVKGVQKYYKMQTSLYQMWLGSSLVSWNTKQCIEKQNANHKLSAI
jgi:hypothetical protein